MLLGLASQRPCQLNAQKLAELTCAHHAHQATIVSAPDPFSEVLSILETEGPKSSKCPQFQPCRLERRPREWHARERLPGLIQSETCAESLPVRKLGHEFHESEIAFTERPSALISHGASSGYVKELVPLFLSIDASTSL